MSRRSKEDIVQSLDIFSYISARLQQVRQVGDEIAACCPIHEDDRPSLSINATTGLWKCHGCSEHGSLFDLHMRINSCDFKTAVDELAQIAGVESTDKPIAIVKSSPQKNKKPPPKNPPIDENLINQWRKNLRLDDALRTRIMDLRCIDSATIEKFEIGHDGRRYTIPIRDSDGKLVNIRRCDPDNRQKMIHYTTYIDNEKCSYGSPPRLYGIDRLAQIPLDTWIIITEGEWDRIVLEKHGLPAVTGTHGASTWLDDWSRALEGRKVLICYDADKAGKLGASSTVAPSVALWAAEVKIADLSTPMATIGPEAKDVTDFFRAGRTRPQLVAAIKDNSKPYQKRYEPDDFAGPNFEVSRVTAYPSEPVLLRFFIEGHEIPIYEPDARIFKNFQSKALTIMHRLLRGPGKKSEKNWEALLFDWIDQAEWLEGLDGKNETKAQLLIWELEEMIWSASMSDSLHDLENGSIYCENSKYYMSLSGIYTACHVLYGQRPEYLLLTQALSAMGCRQTRTRLAGGVKYRVWLIPECVITENRQNHQARMGQLRLIALDE
jgi:hypothetical protein